MTRTTYALRKELIVREMLECGAMSEAELQRHLGLQKVSVRSTLRRMEREGVVARVAKMRPKAGLPHPFLLVKSKKVREYVASLEQGGLDVLDYRLEVADKRAKQSQRELAERLTKPGMNADIVARRLKITPHDAKKKIEKAKRLLAEQPNNPRRKEERMEFFHLRAMQKAYYEGVIDATESGFRNPLVYDGPSVRRRDELKMARDQGFRDAKNSKVIRPLRFGAQRVLRRAECTQQMAAAHA